MKKRMISVLALAMTMTVLAAGPVMSACQAQEEATKAQQDTTNQDATTASSSTVGLGAFTTISAWGSNTDGQLGVDPYVDGTYVGPRSTPVEVSDLLEGGDLKALAAGGYHSLALKDDGSVWAWGNNLFGQLGNGARWNTSPSIGTNTPVQVSGLSGVKALAAGGDHSLAGQ